MNRLQNGRRKMNQTQTNRIEVVDALRGLALCAIVIVHCFEHYNLYYIPENAPQWLTALDKEVWNTTWFLLTGKAFSTFSLLLVSASSSSSTMRPVGACLSGGGLSGACFCCCFSLNSIPSSTTAISCCSIR